MEPTVIAVCNHKGGTGKTTTTYWLARHFATMGLHPLCIDIDSQGSLTRALGGVIDHGNSIGDVLAGRTSLVQAWQPHEADPNINVIGADIRLNETSAYIQGRSPNHNFLERAIRAQASLIRGPILIDCPPSADILIVNALTAADYLIVPVDPDPEAIAGMMRMVSMAAELKEILGKGPQVLGCVVTKCDAQTVAHQTQMKALRSNGCPPVLGTIPLRIGKDAMAKIADAYAGVASTIKERMEVKRVNA
jgi:chromosome partitioning protein